MKSENSEMNESLRTTNENPQFQKIKPEKKKIQEAQ